MFHEETYMKQPGEGLSLFFYSPYTSMSSIYLALANVTTRIFTSVKAICLLRLARSLEQNTNYKVTTKHKHSRELSPKRTKSNGQAKSHKSRGNKVRDPEADPGVQKVSPGEI